MIYTDLVIFGVNGQRENLPTNRAYSVISTQNKHGFGSLTFKIRLPFAKISQYLGNPQVLNVQCKRGKYIFDGRLEDISLQRGDCVFTALGYWRAFSDVLYNALWSNANIKDWFTLSKDYNIAVLGNRTPEKYAIDYDNRIFVGLVKNNTYTNVADICGISYRIPSSSARNIIGIQFNLEMKLPVNWLVQLLTWASDYSTAALANTFTGNAGVQTYAVALNLNAIAVGNPAISFDVINNTGANYNMAGETGTFYMKVTDVRLVSTDSTTSRWINTTLTAARAAGASVSAQVATSANMYVGQKLVIDSGLGPVLSEIVTVLTIPDATHFTATFVNNHANGAQVSAVTCYPDQIISDLIVTTRIANPTQLSASTALIAQSSFDLLNEVYTDASMADIIDYLCSIGDGTQVYEAGVYDNKQLYYRPRSSIARQWYIDYSDPEIKTSIHQMYNSVYAKYQDLLKTDIRSVAATDTTSISRYGLTRQQVADIQTTNPTLATKKRDLTLANLKTIVPQATIKVKQILTTPNTNGLITDPRVGDYITIINMTAIATGSTLDRIRTFRIVETSLDFDKAVLSITPEFSLPSVEYQLANLLTYVSRLAVTPTKNLDRRQT